MEAPGFGRRAMGIEGLPGLKQRAFAPRPRSVLEAILSTASSTLEIGLSATINELEQQLFKLAEQARSNDAQNRCFESLREVRRARSDVMPRFMLNLEAALALVGDAEQAPAFARMSRSKRDELSLIDPADFEESLALQEIASKAEIRNSQSLFALGQRFGVLAGAPAVEADELPVGPHRLCECIRHASTCIEIPLEHRVLMFRMFDRHCMSVVGALYDQLNELCVRQRVLPNLQFQSRVKKSESQASAAAYLHSSAGGRPGQSQQQREQAATATLGHADSVARPTTQPRGGESSTPRGGGGSGAGTGADGGSGSVATTGFVASGPARPADRGPTAEQKAAAFANPMTGWPGTPPAYHPDRAGETDARDLEFFDTMRDLLAGRRHALGLEEPMDGKATHAVRSEDVQAVLGAIQNKPAPPMLIGGKLVSRSVSHLKQDVLNQLRQLTPEGQQPRLSERDTDTIDLVGMLFDQLVKDSKPGGAAQDLLTRLQIPLLRVALKDKSFFTRRAHPARQLLNAVAEAGVFWLDDESDDRAAVDKMRLMVDRVTQEYDDKPELFEDLLTDLSKHLGTLSRKSDVAERRHVDAAKGRERLELARNTAGLAISSRLKDRKPSALIKTLLEQAWTDVLAITILRQGENSEAYHRRLGVADRLVDRLINENRSGNAVADDKEVEALKHEVEAGLGQVGYHVEDVRTLVNRLFEGPATPANDDPTTLTELAVKLKARSRLGEDAEADVAHKRSPGKLKLVPPLSEEEQRIVERLRSVPFGTWFEFVTNQQGDRVRRKLSWFSTVTGRCLFVNQRGARTDEKSMEQLARDIGRGHAHVVEAQKEPLIDRAWNAIMSTLRQFAGNAPKPA